MAGREPVGRYLGNGRWKMDLGQASVWSGSALMGRVRLKGRDRGCVPAGQGLQLLSLHPLL